MKSKSKPKFYSISRFRAQDGVTVGRLNIYGEISSEQFRGDEATPNRMQEQLEAMGKISRLDVHIYSNGGDVFAGLAIYRMLRQRTEPVHAYIEGIAASIATVIACGADVVYIGETDMLMVHDPSVLLFMESLNAGEARELADELDTIRQPMIAAYAEKTGKTEAEIIAIMDGPKGKGTWFNAAEAIDFGLADEYTPDDKRPRQVAACLQPAVLAWKGQAIKMSRAPVGPGPRASSKTTSKGVEKTMSKKRKTRSKRRVRRAELEMIDMICPHCGAEVALNPETAEVALVGLDGADLPEEGGELPVEARRSLGRHRAELFTVTCPNCEQEFVWDTDAQDDGEEGGTVIETEEVGADDLDLPEEEEEPTARRTASARRIVHAHRKPAKSRPAARTARRMRAEVAETTCPECSAAVFYDTDEAQVITDENGIEGYLLTCAECGAEFLEALEAAVPEAIPTAAPAAYRMGVQAERRRLLALDDIAEAVPGCAEMIAAAKRTGASAESMSRNVFKAMATNPAMAGQRHRAALERDAQAAGLNNMQTPQHRSPRSAYTNGVLNKLNDR